MKQNNTALTPDALAVVASALGVSDDVVKRWQRNIERGRMVATVEKEKNGVQHLVLRYNELQDPSPLPQLDD